ncbi:cytochrome-c peroxidase [Gammaproteobacteria bacterium 45_16_T64]|nr:cytochrome-c peroxidase [Gammaproteobacteria bacterium 45_16_T64]
MLAIPFNTFALDDNALRQQASLLTGTIPTTMPGAEHDTPAQVALGKKLYFDKRLSINNTQSCNGCHNIQGKAGGVDNQSFSKGAEGALGGRNSPTVLNAGFHLAQFWDGRAATLADQAKGPILNPVEMGMPSAEAVMEKLSSLDNYTTLFTQAFGTGDASAPMKDFTYDNLANAIASFERTLVTQDRYDDYLRGDNDALNAQEKRGLQTFIAKGCTACHSGPLLGGNVFQKMGVVKPYENQKDQGRFDLTQLNSDKMVFKAPSLRNIELTAPYFHDGQVATLEEAVSVMAELQLGVTLTDNEVGDISVFLGALTDKTRE